MATQLERERVAESTAAYHEREYSRWLNVWANLNGGEPEEDELRRRFLFHWREIKAARVRLIAIQLEDFDARDLVNLCRRAA